MIDAHVLVFSRAQTMLQDWKTVRVVAEGPNMV